MYHVIGLDIHRVVREMATTLWLNTRIAYIRLKTITAGVHASTAGAHKQVAT